MMVRLSIDYTKNEIASINCCSELIDIDISCRMEVGETFFFTMYGYEWMGECTGVHHLFYGDLMTERKLADGRIKTYGRHLPMFKLNAHAVRKIPT